MDTPVPARGRPESLQASSTSPVASSAKWPSRRRWQSRGDESGFTLVEVLITIVIMGIAVVALTGGMLNAISNSDLHRQDIVLDSLLRNYAEGITSASEQSCLQGAPTITTANTAPAGYSVWITSVNGGAVAQTTTATCPPTGLSSQLGLTATAPGGTTASLTLTVAVP